MKTLHTINSTDLLSGDIVHVLNYKGEFIPYRTILEVTDNFVKYDHGTLRICAGHKTGATYVLVERPLPKEIGALFAGYLRVSPSHWIKTPTSGDTTKLYSNEYVQESVK